MKRKQLPGGVYPWEIAQAKRDAEWCAAMDRIERAEPLLNYEEHCSPWPAFCPPSQRVEFIYLKQPTTNHQEHIMTDRIRHLTVTLARDMRDDDAERLIDAIIMIKGVASVRPHVVESGDYGARDAVSADLQRKLQALIREFFSQHQ